MRFSRGRVQVLYSYLPGSLFPHDQYRYCKVTDIVLREDSAVNRPAVAEAVSETLRHWQNDWQRQGFADPRNPNTFAKNYVVGAPGEVRFSPYPEMLQCQECLKVYLLAHLERLHAAPGLCPDAECRGHLNQFQFVQAHNCGRLEQIYLNFRGCEKHGTAGLYFHDTGRVMTARWRCRLCGGAEVARLRQTPCNCAYSEQVANSASGRRMRVYSISDPAVFRPVVVPFVNFDEDQLIDISEPNAKMAILARLWGLTELPVSELRTQANSANKDSDSEVETLIKALEEVDPNNERVREYRSKQQASQEQAHLLKRVLDLAGVEFEDGLHIRRSTCEHVAVLDTLKSETVQNVAKRLRKTGEEASALRIESAQRYANEVMGLSEILALEDFPVGLCAVGYTRVSKSPSESILNPFPAVEGRTPLYTVTTTTEGIYFRLDPLKVVMWLVRNGIVAGNVPSSKPDAWSWLYRRCSGLRCMPHEEEYYEPAATAIRTLLHSISHILLRNVEWSGYSAQSLGEYLMPEGLSCVLYANRYTEANIGGLLTLFEQELKSWLEASYQSGEDCVFDPFCAEGGSSCVGCLHREYGCPTFNRELSRSTLYGGVISHQGPGALPFSDVSSGYWAQG